MSKGKTIPSLSDVLNGVDSANWGASRKPKILICYLCGTERTNWVNPDLCANLVEMSHDSRFAVKLLPVRDCRPFDTARNLSMYFARKLNPDWMVSFDNDVYVRENPLNIIAAAHHDKDKDFIGLGYAGGQTSGAEIFPDSGGTAQFFMMPPQIPAIPEVNGGGLREVDWVPGGVLMIRNTIWHKIPRGPWFKWLPGNDELLSLDPVAEDNYFCRLVKRHGFKIWSHTGNVAQHYHTTNFTGLANAFTHFDRKEKDFNEALQEVKGRAPKASKWRTFLRKWRILCP